MMEVSLAIIAVTKATAGRIEREGFNFGLKLTALTLDLCTHALSIMAWL